MTLELIPDSLLADLRDLAGAADAEPVWPTRSWETIGAAGVLGWSVPRRYGGLETDALGLLAGYEVLAGACMTTCFLLSQREAAVRRIVDSGNEELCRELLRPLACGGRFATVGLSQLTTSRQYGQPALVARDLGTSFELEGVMPWVTGAPEADHFVAGAVLEDGRQILIVVPGDLPGVEVGPPLPLMALQGSVTGEVVCRGVRVDRRFLLAGPAERVMNTGRGGTGGLETSCLALGLAGAAIDYLHHEAVERPELQIHAEPLERSRSEVRGELRRLARDGSTADSAAELRGQANMLVLQATQTALTASKGAGFLRHHPAQRWARQALFFLVWSCPRPAVEATLAFLSPVGPTCS